METLRGNCLFPLSPFLAGSYAKRPSLVFIFWQGWRQGGRAISETLISAGGGGGGPKRQDGTFFFPPYTNKKEEKESSKFVLNPPLAVAWRHRRRGAQKAARARGGRDFPLAAQRTRGGEKNKTLKSFPSPPPGS